MNRICQLSYRLSVAGWEKNRNWWILYESKAAADFKGDICALEIKLISSVWLVYYYIWWIYTGSLSLSSPQRTPPATKIMWIIQSMICVMWKMRATKAFYSFNLNYPLQGATKSASSNTPLMGKIHKDFITCDHLWSSLQSDWQWRVCVITVIKKLFFRP